VDQGREHGMSPASLCSRVDSQSHYRYPTVECGFSRPGCHQCCWSHVDTRGQHGQIRGDPHRAARLGRGDLLSPVPGLRSRNRVCPAGECRVRALRPAGIRVAATGPRLATSADRCSERGRSVQPCLRLARRAPEWAGLATPLITSNALTATARAHCGVASAALWHGAAQVRCGDPA
jgi:hypothetical protein